MGHLPLSRLRRSIRLKGHDYCQPGGYAITISTAHRAPLFGEIVDGVVVLNPFGQIARQCWLDIPNHFPNVVLDAFVIMPNHMHGILFLVETRDPSPRQEHASMRPRGPTRQSVGAIVGSYKSAVTKWIRRTDPSVKAPIWHRNYFERIIRDEDHLIRTRIYIAENPKKAAKKGDAGGAFRGRSL